ncbi:MAG: RnfABCDGE type electron transport complex subunit D [Oscillospiraceae bacterium]
MNKLAISSSPHITGSNSTRKIMLDVIIALMPAAAASCWIFGIRALILIAVCVITCVAAEALYCVIAKKPIPVGDLSAVVTGIMLAFNLPASLPVWQAVVGSVVTIVVVKQLFGGIGCNFVNPALAGRVIMAVSFTGTMVNYSFPDSAVDLLSSSTPLSVIWAGKAAELELWQLFIGSVGGVIGESSCLALLIGGLYLVIRKVIKPIIPLAYIGSAYIFLTLFGCAAPLVSILSGGLFLGAIFMATDYVTTPYTNTGKLIFGIGCGLITAVIRTFANSTEGVSYAILIMNLLVPYINQWVRRKPYGTEATR